MDPVLKKLLNRLNLSKKASPQYFQTFQDAKLASHGNGYEEEELVDVVFQKTLAFRDHFSTLNSLSLTEASSESLLSLLLTLQTLPSREIRVIDYGGACGIHYFIAKAGLRGDNVKIHWSVVETPALVRKARLMETDELYFFDNIAEAVRTMGGVDLLHSSGAIQYLPDPYESLNDIVNAGAPFLMLNRLALSTGDKDIIKIQETKLSANGPGPLPTGFDDRICRYPITYIQRDKLNKFIQDHYRMRFDFNERKLSHLDGQPIIASGFLAERK